MKEIKERPILFSGSMVRAIMAGTKTQTRRLVEPQPERIGESGGVRIILDMPPPPCFVMERLWVRENFRAKSWSADGGWGEIEYQAGGALLINGAPWNFADAYPEKHPVDRWRSARYMPRWASRLLLQIESAKVERLNDISEDDAHSEGMDIFSWGEAGDIWLGQHGDEKYPDTRDPRKVFAHLWDKINGKRANWASNPWVWVVSFKKVQP